jgi:hypothetical protein
MTELTHHLDPNVAQGFKDDSNIAKITKSVEQGAATTVLVEIRKEYEGVGGKYLEDARAWASTPDSAPYEYGYASWAFNQRLEDMPWKDSNRFVGSEEK